MSNPRPDSSGLYVQRTRSGQGICPLRGDGLAPQAPAPHRDEARQTPPASAGRSPRPPQVYSAEAAAKAGCCEGGRYGRRRPERRDAPVGGGEEAQAKRTALGDGEGARGIPPRLGRRAREAISEGRSKGRKEAHRRRRAGSQLSDPAQGPCDGEQEPRSPRGAGVEFDLLTTPTPPQRRAFELLGVRPAL